MGRKEDAFTLLELIIALTIGTAIIVLVSVSVRMGFFQMGRGSKALEESLREKNAVHFFCQQVASIRSEGNGGEEIFNGDAKNILFVTPMSIEKNYSNGLMTATFFLEKEETGVKLNYKEKRHIPVENVEEFKVEFASIFDQNESITIFKGFDEIVFRFLGSEDSEGDGPTSVKSDAVWKESWLEEEKLPKAIKLVLSKNGINREIVAPIMVMY